MKRRQTYRESIPSYERVSTYPEYWKLVEWLATPTPARRPATQKELAKELSVHFTTLSRWIAIPECYRDVRQRIKQELRGELPNVLYALKNKIFKDGNAKEIKLFLQWADDFVEKHEVEHRGALDIETPEVRKLVADFESKLKETLTKKGDSAKE